MFVDLEQAVLGDRRPEVNVSLRQGEQEQTSEIIILEKVRAKDISCKVTWTYQWTRQLCSDTWTDSETG